MLDRAAVLLDTVRAAAPTSPELWDALANLAIARRDFPAALAALTELVALDPARWTAWYNLATVSQQSGRAAEARAAYERVIVLAPTHVEAFVNLASLERLAGDRARATDLLRQACAIRPDDPVPHEVLANLLAETGSAETAAPAARAKTLRERRQARALGDRLPPPWHFGMMNDTPRNRAFEQALRRTIRPGMRVLEIGAGSGLLAMMAARAGAAHVTSCEMVPEVAEVARQIVARNGFADRVTIVNGSSFELEVGVELPARCDALVAEVLSSDVVGEGAIAALADARRRLLVPGAPLIPDRAFAMAALVASKGLDPWFSVGTVEGFDLSPFNRFSMRKVLLPTAFPAADYIELLSAERAVLSLDFHADQPVESEQQVDFTVTAPGRCIGILQWLKISLSDGITHENHPLHHSGASAWSVFIHRFAHPIEVRAGETVSARLRATAKATGWGLVDVT